MNPLDTTTLCTPGSKDPNLLGISLGGMVAQKVVLKAPLVVDGDHDRMVPTINTHDLAQQLPNSQPITCPTAEHGAAFPFHAVSLRRPRDLRMPASARPA